MEKYVSCERVMQQADQVTFMGFGAEERKKHFMDLVSAILEACKNVDAVKVVRCVDCKFCRTFFPEKEIGKEARQVWYCDLYRCNRKTDEFCSDGERKQEA